MICPTIEHAVDQNCPLSLVFLTDTGNRHRKNINTKHENHNCYRCNLRFNNIMDLQKHAVKETIENKTNKKG